MRNKAQGMVEYSVLIAVIVAALVSMQIYLKRGMQGRLRVQAEQLSAGNFYSPGATNANSLVTTTSRETSRSYSDPGDGNISETNATINQVTNKTEEVLSFSDEVRR